MGAEVEEFDDGLRVAGRSQLHGAKIDPRGDHRIAMAFTIAGLLRRRRVPKSLMRNAWPYLFRNSLICWNLWLKGNAARPLDVRTHLLSSVRLR